MSEYTTVSTDLQENLRAADRLVNTIGAQRDEVERAYQRGWRECAEALAYIGAEMWTAGYWAREADRKAEWEEFQTWLRRRCDTRTFEERRAEELAACRSRPGDFVGLENDPGCLDALRASVKSIAINDRRAA